MWGVHGYGSGDITANWRDGITGHLEDEDVRLQIESGDEDATCSECGEVIHEYYDSGAGTTDAERTKYEGHDLDCDRMGEPADRNPPSTWSNGASITVDEEENAITVGISIGDPRGAFTMTVRRLPDGRLVMHVPHPDNSLLHMKLTELHTGTYEVGG